MALSLLLLCLLCNNIRVGAPAAAAAAEAVGDAGLADAATAAAGAAGAADAEANVADGIAPHWEIICTSASGHSGVCYQPSDCEREHGVPDGLCAEGLGVCCVAFVRNCNSETSHNDTRFTNPNNPSAETGKVSNCELTVNPMSNNICQMRLDLDTFKLEQPEAANGHCTEAFMTVTGGSSNVPILCGENGGHHLYVEVEPSQSITINIDASGAGALWDIRVSQVECDSVNRAPAGCLQYYRDTSGEVKSFNYRGSGAAISETGQLANQHYGVCLQSRAGYCSVTWSKPESEGPYYFTVTGDAAGADPNNPATFPSVTGDACQTDYVIIPNGDVTDAQLPPVTSSDRFCGLRFPPAVQSSVQPFVMYVVTDDTELLPQPATSDNGNQGFNLMYRVNPCMGSG